MPITTTTFVFHVLSGSTRLGQLGDEHEINQTILIEKLDGSNFNIVTDVEKAIDESVIPAVNQLYGSSPPATGTSWQQFARFRGYQLRTLDNGKATCDLRWTTYYTPNPTSTTTLSYELPSSTEYQTVVRSTQIYRTSWTTNPPQSLDTSVDVGGTPISGNMSGQPMQVPQTRVRMRFMQDASAVAMDTAATTLANYVDKMNSHAFLGCAIRTLVCEGVNVVKLAGEYYELVFDFLYDPWYHHEQVATVAADGRPNRSGSDLAEVKWKRLPRSTTDFNNLYGSDANLQTITENGWWT